MTRRIRFEDQRMADDARRTAQETSRDGEEVGPSRQIVERRLPLDSSARYTSVMERGPAVVRATGTLPARSDGRPRHGLRMAVTWFPAEDGRAAQARASGLGLPCRPLQGQRVCPAVVPLGLQQRGGTGRNPRGDHHPSEARGHSGRQVDRRGTARGRRTERDRLPHPRGRRRGTAPDTRTSR